MGLILYFSALKELYQFNYTGSKSHRKAKKFVASLDLNSKLENNSNVPHNYLEKVQWYVMEFEFSCRNLDSIFQIHSSQSSKKAQEFAAVLGVLSDLLIDDLRLEEKDLLQIFDKREANSDSSAVLNLFQHYYQHFREVAQVETYPDRLKYLDLVLKAQIKSRAQFDPELSKEAAEQICRDKCGYSLLFMRSMIDKKISQDEVSTWYELGSYIQFANDSQDLPKDLKNEMRTFATCRSTYSEIQSDLIRQKEIAFKLLQTLPVKPKKIRFLREILSVMHEAILTKIGVYEKLSRRIINDLQKIPNTRIRKKTSSINLLAQISLKRLKGNLKKAQNH